MYNCQLKKFIRGKGDIFLLSRRRIFRLSLVLGILVLGALVSILIYYFLLRGDSNSNSIIHKWLSDPTIRQILKNEALSECKDFPFTLPSSGLIGLLWDDPARPYSRFRTHSGIDIFGDGSEGTVPIYAAYDGYLVRETDWRSTVIIEHVDPLNPDHPVIWTYYTHMANVDGTISYIQSEFPPGSNRIWVEKGTLLGYQGTFAGTGAPIAMHLHFSIVKADPEGSYLNESFVENTLDPSPYLGLNLDYDPSTERPLTCLN